MVQTLKRAAVYTGLLFVILVAGAAVTQINLVTQVKGILGIANGGTNLSAVPGSNGQLIFNNSGAYGAEDPVVSGPDANGAAPTKNPILTAGWDGTDVRIILTDASGHVITVVSGTVTVTGTVTANQGGTWTIQPGNTANTTPWLFTINQGGNSATVTASGALKVDGSAVTQPVSGTFFQATQPVSIAGNQAVNIVQLAGSNLGAMANYGTSPGAVLVPGVNAFITNTPNVTIQTDATVNLDQVHGTATDTNSGNKSAGTMRVVLATDQPQLTNKLLVTPDADSTVVQEASATNTNMTSTCYLTSAASTNSTNCKASAGNVYGIYVINTTTTNYFLRMYNASSAPTCSSATGFIETIPALGAAANGGGISRMQMAQGYATGIGFCLTGGGSSTDNTNAATGVYVTILYK